MKFPLSILDVKTINRFWAQIQISSANECWPWLGASSSKYGVLNIEGKNYQAHQIAFFYAKGYLNNFHRICHTCDKPLCCNANHLFSGTQRDNLHDMYSKGRRLYENLDDQEIALTRWLIEGGILQKDIAHYFETSPSSISRIHRDQYHIKRRKLYACPPRYDR